MIYFDLKLKYEIHNKFKFEFVFVLYNKEMNTTINPETGRKVIIGGPTYRRMAKKYTGRMFLERACCKSI